MFDRIQLGCVAGQPLQGESLPLGRHEVADQHTAMAGQTVPDHQQRPPQVPHQVLQKLDDLRSLDRARKELEVKVPPRNPGHHRKRLPVEVELEHRRLTPRRPSPHAVGPFTQSAFVDEDDGLASFCSVFFNSGQRWRFHLRMAGSFRSKARPAGRCGVQPRSRSRRQACTVEYFTPHSRSIRSATRQAVQRLVPYPRACGPLFKPCRIRWRSAAVSWAGRPARGARFRAPGPPCSNCRAQRLTDCRCTPTRRATSASGMPCLSSRAAFRRRCSSFTRSRLSPAGCPIAGEYNPNGLLVSLYYVILFSSPHRPYRLCAYWECALSPTYKYAIHCRPERRSKQMEKFKSNS